jgi:hypothetical protein
MANRCGCKRCTSGQPHTPFDATGLERLMDLLHPPAFPRKARRLVSYDQPAPRCSTVVPRQPWDPRPARTAA